MKKYSLFSVPIFLIFTLFTMQASASDITINISAHFKCNFLAKYMKKHGYHFIREVPFRHGLKTNVFAANNAEVIVKNKYDTVLKNGKTDKEGNFTVSVPRENNYKIVVRFHDREIEEVITPEEDTCVIDLGFFNSDIVGKWIHTPRTSYCYDCDLRYLEARKYWK